MNISIIGVSLLAYKQFTHIRFAHSSTRLQITYSICITVLMGQIFGKSDEAHSFDDRSKDEEVDLFWASAPSDAYTICEEEADIDLFWSWKLGPSTTNTTREPYEEIDLFWSYTPGPPTTNTKCDCDEEVDLFWPSAGQDKTPEVVALPADRHGDGK